MKLDQVTLMFSYALALFFTVVCAKSTNDATYYSVVGSIQEQTDEIQRQLSILDDIKTVIYCNGMNCPKWRCQDDSAIIHGYCCGCPNSPLENIPVLCADDLRCPNKLEKPKLCQDYNFMKKCCCSRLRFTP